MNAQILSTLRKHNMLTYGDGVILGLSGGADSMCLLHMLLELRETHGLTIVCVHVNHGIRKAADTDEAFVKSSCDTLSIELRTYRVDAKSHSAKNKQSIEAAARELRYQCFEDARQYFSQTYDGKNFKIATAHNLNDVSETVLMNFLRGSGLQGLSGIPPVRGNIIRPLIDIGRADIEHYCAEHGVAFVTDETNLQNDYTRNKLRNELIPYIEREFNENIINTLARNSALIAADENFLGKTAQTALDSCLKYCGGSTVTLDIPTLHTFHNAVVRRVLRLALEQLLGNLHDISYSHIESALEISHGQTGKSANLAANIIAEKSYTSLELKFCDTPAPQGFAYELELGKPICIAEIKKHVLVSKHKPQDLPHGASCKAFIMTAPLMLRTRQNGDKIYLKRIDGTTKLKDYFINKKIPREEREKTALLAHGSDILWVVNLHDLTSDKYTPPAGEIHNTIYVTIWGKTNETRDCNTNDNQRGN